MFLTTTLVDMENRMFYMIMHCTGNTKDVNLVDGGVSMYEIKRFCKDRRMMMYALDDEEKSI